MPTSVRHACIETVLKKELAPYDSWSVNRDTEKLAPSATHFWTMTHSGHETQFHQLLKPTQPRALPLSLALPRSVRPPPTPATCSRPPGEASTSGVPKLREGCSQPGPGPRNRPHPVSHAVFLDLRPPGPRPSSPVTPAARPSETQARTPGQATVNTAGRDTLHPAHPGHAPSLSAPGRPARSLGFRLSCRCFVSRRILAAHRAGRPRPRPRGLTGVAISGPGDVGP